MKPIVLASALLSTLPAVRGALNGYAFGSAFMLGSTLSSSPLDIVSLTTTFTPGPAPSPQNGELYLWPGLATVDDEFLYASLEQMDPSLAQCATSSTDEWCITAQYVGSAGLISGPYLPLTGSESITLNIERDTSSSANPWTTTVSIGGSIVSKITTPGGRASAFGLANVCFDACTSTPDAQTYRNTTIVLAAAQPAFGGGATTDLGTTFGGMASADGGQVWTIDEIVVPKGAHQ